MNVKNLQRVVSISKDLDHANKQIKNLDSLDDARIWTLNSANDRSISVIITEREKKLIKEGLTKSYNAVIDGYNNELKEL